MTATLADIQAKYGDSVYPLYKDEMHAPYMENEKIKDPIVEFDNRVASLSMSKIPQQSIAKHLGVATTKITESLRKTGGTVTEVPEISVGYKGVVLVDENNDGKVQCSECGKWFKMLGPHLNRDHKINTTEYKDKHGLSRRVALCSKQTSEKFSKNTEGILQNSLWKKNPERMKKILLEVNKKAVEERKKTKDKIQTKNRYGLCDAQITSRLLIVRDMVGKPNLREVTNRDLQKYDANLYNAMKNKYGSFKNACNSLGIKHLGMNKYEDSELIAKLRNYVMVKKNIPSSTKFDKQIYRRYFGSWRRAKMMAGLDQLLQEVK